MKETTVGARFQIVIPKQVREQFDLKPASKVRVEARTDCIVIYPQNKASALRGIGADLVDGRDATDYVAELRAEWESLS